MKNARFLSSTAAIVGLWIALAAFVWLTSALLPRRVATHFNAAGQPNGWMTRAGHIQFTLVLGAFVPTLILGGFTAIERHDGHGWNIPRKDYWLAPARREATLDFLRRHAVRFAGMFIGFLAAIHLSILVANARSPISLPLSLVAWVIGPYLIANVIWVIVLARRFWGKSR